MGACPKSKKPFYINTTASPEDAIYHYNNNALTFLNVGKSMGDEMILAINDMSFCYQDCTDPILPSVVSIGNRVWNDLNRNGLNEPDEPGIPGVSLVLWSDSDGDAVPDWQGFGGVRVTDENGYYKFSGLQPGNYVVFVWQVNNWGAGDPLEHFVSTNGLQPNANNNVDFDNNGFGNPFTDIMSGIVALGINEEPLNDGDPFNCYFNYDANGNNSIDFGFYDPRVITSNEDLHTEADWIQLFPMPVTDKFTLKKKLAGICRIEIYDALGRTLRTDEFNDDTHAVDISSFPAGLYFVKLNTPTPINGYGQMFKLIKR